ncbi:MAG TPA: TlpA disulfide reductase family protein, partial [Verrucomicrobiae bacterium]|nr:TlpA disulfide reductase family protein [Verrucomicrobiae bacterium]
ILVILLAAVAVVALAMVASRTPVGNVKPENAAGSLPPAPSVAIKDLQGNTVTLEQFRGKVVLVNFWATWCSPCQIEMPWFVGFQEKYGPRGFTVLGVAMDEEGKSVVEPFIEKERFDLDGQKVKINYPILVGNDTIADQFGGLIGLPTTLVISRDGKITKRFIGLVSHDKIVAEIESLL